MLKKKRIEFDSLGVKKIAYKRLLEHDVKVLSKPIPSSCGMAKVFFCIDPDNVRIEIVEMLK